MKTKLLTICTIILLSTYTASAQSSSLGLRFGGTSGISYKHNSAADRTFEGILGFWGNGFGLTGLRERSTIAFNEPSLRWYYGAGAHIAFYNSRSQGNDFGRGGRAYTDNEMGFGLDGTLELEYRLNDIPFAFSLGFKPFIEIDTDGRVHGGPDPALGIKFIF